MITRWLIAINLIAFVWEYLVAGPGVISGNGNMLAVLERGALVPALVTHDGQWWRILTGAFLHGNLLHIAVNMWSLWILGTFVENAIGSWRFLLLYAFSLVVSGLGVVYLSDPMTPVVGASGAIFGLFGGLFAIGFKRGREGMELVKANVAILIVNIAITFLSPSIAWQAHVFGFIAGFIATLPLYQPPRAVHPVVTDGRTGTALEAEYQPPQTSRDPR